MSYLITAACTERMIMPCGINSVLKATICGRLALVLPMGVVRIAWTETKSRQTIFDSIPKGCATPGYRYWVHAL